MSAASACADTLFRVEGRDRFRVGAHDMRGEITYSGTQHLYVKRVGHSTRYTALVDYTKVDQGARSKAVARFVSLLSSDGEQHDVTNDDPDYLTVLNQPFAVQLDAGTFHDLSQLKGTVPFDLPSPITGATLHGTIKKIADGIVGGTRVLGVAFEAKGPLSGALPDRPQLKLIGTITMRGTAYYAYGALGLVALKAVLAIDGTLATGNANDKVAIEYMRRLRSTALRTADL
jgi:hypothetical protein